MLNHKVGVRRVEGEGKDEAIKDIMLEMEILLSKLDGLIKVYRALSENRVKAKIEIEKDDSAIKIRLLNPEMLYDPIDVFEFNPNTTIGEAYEKILNSESLRVKLMKDLGVSLVRIADIVRKSLNLLKSCINGNTGKA